MHYIYEMCFRDCACVTCNIILRVYNVAIATIIATPINVNGTIDDGVDEDLDLRKRVDGVYEDSEVDAVDRRSRARGAIWRQSRAPRFA